MAEETSQKETQKETSVSIRVDGQEVLAKPGQLLIDACSDAGVYIPYFCYHPRMSPVGMCRMCLVEVDSGRGPALMTSCTLPVAPDMEVTTESDTVKKAQDGVLEFLLINHPLDCPVCDKGGECPLQDQTMAFGPGESRFVENKRHFVKPIPISSQIFLDRERCILCDRCTRFADEVAGEALISFQGRGQHTEVNTFPEADFENYFSGNTVQICPVGALTAKPYRFKARPWDLLEVFSTYPNPMGDRIVLHASNNELVRILGMDSDAVNWGWLTDKDRFGFQAVSSPNRIKQPMVRKAGELVEVSWHEAISTAASFISSSWDEIDTTDIAIIGGADLPNEDQYAWTRLAKGVICTDNVDALVGDSFPSEFLVGIPRVTLNQALEPGSLVVVLGSDIKEELGTLYLRLRHALINDGVDLVELTAGKTSLTHLAKHSHRVFPGEISRAVKEILKSKGTDEMADVAAAISKAASESKLTVIFSASSLAESPNLVAAAAQSFSEAYGESVRIVPLLRKGNSFGAVDMGLVPGALPGRNVMETGEKKCLEVWGKLKNEKGMNAPEILKAISRGKISTLILLGEDPLGSSVDSRLIENVLNSSNKPKLIALDKFMTPTLSSYADVIFPVAALGEREGSHTNLEGRISPLNKIISPNSSVRCEWEIAQELSRHLGVDMGFENLSGIWEEIQSVSPLHEGISFSDIQNSEDGIVPDQKANQAEGSASFIKSILLEKDFAQGGIAKDNYAHRLVVRRPMYDGSVWQTNCESFEPYFSNPSVIKLHPEELTRLGIQKGSSVEVSHTKGTIKPIILIAEEDASLMPGVAAMDFSSSTLNVDSTKSHPPDSSHPPPSAMLIDSELTVNDVVIKNIGSPDTFSK